jgi:hypothetical protein
MLYIKLLGDNSVLSKNTYLKTTVPAVDLTTLAKPGSTRYAYSFWLYVNNLKSGTNTNTVFTVLRAAGTAGIFKVGFDQMDIKLNVTIANDTESITESSAKTITITPNFPLQKWVFVIISLDNTQLDLYLDGKIVNSQVLTIKPAVPDGIDPSITFGIGVDMFISKLNRQTTPMDPQTAWSMYMSGNGYSSLFSSYGLNMIFSKDQVEQKNIAIF